MITAKNTLILLTISVGLVIFGAGMYGVGQNFIAEKFCNGMGFTTGFATMTGVTCAAYTDFPYNQNQPTNK